MNLVWLQISEDSFSWRGSILLYLISGEVIGTLCKRVGPQIYERCKSTILMGISSNLERDTMMDGSISDADQSEKLIEKLSSSPRGEKVCLSLTKPTKWHVHPAKTWINLGIRPVWSESLLFAWRKLGSLATHWVHSEDSDQTGQMPRLIWVFAGRTVILLVLSWGGSINGW